MNKSCYGIRLSPAPVFETDAKEGETRSEFYRRVAEEAVQILKNHFTESTDEWICGFGIASITLPWKTVVNYNYVQNELGVHMELQHRLWPEQEVVETESSVAKA